MTDATTGPGTGARKSADADGTTRRTAAPTPVETEREGREGREGTGRGLGESTDRNQESVGGGDSGHGRTVPPFPTPDEARTEDSGGAAGTTGVTDTTDLTEPGTGTSGTGTATSGTGSSARLLPHEECDKLELRLRQAVSGFVDEPRNAVREADQVVEEIAGRFAEAVTRRRRTLRSSWQDGDEARSKGTHPDTEQLRLALRDYRALAERLLHG
ncbi:hypothetical protein [Streptomyces gilvus]|uniref:hypothetical protein n=1 Tax=Streptomyces gilvus TaxID=2920937 RepID=UPI001F0F6ABC|nr:hypothetical protein [Streptomyces sp. CME 23]MCH5677052.1 hypothetical protein [Streptomyces sp. CME 23]